MKRFFFMFVAAVLFLAPAIVAAAPVYFTIEGQVSYIDDKAGYARYAGVEIGDTVQYVMAVDTEAQGTYTQRGNTYEQPGTSYSSLVKGVLGGYSDTNVASTLNYGMDFGSQAYFYGGNANANFYAIDHGKGVSQWTEGTVLEQVFEESYAWRGHRMSRIELQNATITHVATHATPVPAGILLLGSGMGALVLVRRRIRPID